MIYDTTCYVLYIMYHLLVDDVVDVVTTTTWCSGLRNHNTCDVLTTTTWCTTYYIYGIS